MKKIYTLIITIFLFLLSYSSSIGSSGIDNHCNSCEEDYDTNEESTIYYFDYSNKSIDKILIDIQNAVKAAKGVDYIIACLGEIPATEKPSDINELPIPKVQQDLVIQLSKFGKPIILVLVEGRPRIIKDIEPLIDVIILAYLPGDEGGRAIVDVIFGEINPSGKLPITYPKYTGNALNYLHKRADIRDKNWGFDGFYPQYEFLCLNLFG